MPVDLGLKQLLDSALGNRIFTEDETKKVYNYVAKEGVSDAEVDQILTQLKGLVDPGNATPLDFSTPTRRRNLGTFLARLDQIHALPLDKDAARRPDGSIDWIKALQTTQAPPPGPAGDELPKKAFGGERITLGPAGEIALDGKALTPQTLAAASFGLARPGQLEALTPAQKTGLIGGLFAGLEASLPIATDDAARPDKLLGATGSLEVLHELAGALDAASIDRLLALSEKLPNALCKQIWAETLDGAPTSAEQKAKLAAFARPEGGVELLQIFRAALAEEQKAGGQRISGAASQPLLETLAFARTPEAAQAVLSTVAKYRDADPASPGRFDDGEVAALRTLLTGYVKSYPQLDFGFGYLVADADKALATWANQRLRPTLDKALQKQPPTFAATPVSAAQVEQLKTLLPGIRDEATLAELGRALASAGELFGVARGKLLPPAAFALFFRAAERAMGEREHTPDGMLDAKVVSEGVREEARAIGVELTPLLRELSARPPTVAGVKTNAEGAAYVRGLLENNLRSELSAGNIATAIKVIAGKFGSLEGEGLNSFKRLIDGYKAEWPNSTLFDFNKLGRMASFLVEGRTAPLCTIGGKKVPLSDFYAATARGVAAGFLPEALGYPWMAERWGMRAKESVELLDVIAQLTSEGKGPLLELQKLYPDKKISIDVTGAAGAHEQFLYSVEGVGRFTQASNGTISAYAGVGEPKLFSATIGADGALDVQLPPAGSLRTTNWPRQTSYAVGDIVDVQYFDPNAATNATEGQPFESQQKILKGEILGYDAAGNYRVGYQLPDGTKAELALTMRQIQVANDPHNYSFKGSSFYDVSVDLAAQPALKAFIDGAQPIIDQHLPKGKVLEMTAAQLAKAQRACVAALIEYSEAHVHYPADKGPGIDAESAKFHELMDGLGWQKLPLEELIKIGKGVCRHQCIIHQLLLQAAGIDSRISVGAANTADGRFRGYHAWNELSLADNARYLSDLTWSDTAIPLWSGAYDVDKRRRELLDMTASLDDNLVG